MSYHDCGLSRRDFLESTLMAMGLTSLVACASGSLAGPSANFKSFSVTVSQYPALASVGGVAVVDNGSRSGSPVALVRTGDATFLALSLVCPHQGVTVQPVSNGFYCPGHGATYSTNGSFISGPNRANLRSYAVSYDQAAGMVQVG